MKYSAIAAVVLGAGLLLWLLFWPAPIDAVAWQPPDPPAMAGDYAPNSLLQKATLLAQGKIYGPEDIAVDDDGILYGGTQDGKIVRVHTDGRVEDWVNTGGRPLGLQFDASGNLIVCDAYKGLLSVDRSGKVSVLATEAGGVPFGFTNDLDIASDGRIYFTDASSQWNQSAYMLDLMEGRPWGRFLVFDPATGNTRVLVDDIHFANGVALSADQDFVLINETWRYRILRYWLKGERQGTRDVFIDNLPGFPDGISGNRDGTFWVALPTPRNPTVDRLYPHPWLREILVKLPESLQPEPVAYGFVLGLSEEGRVIANLQDPAGTHLQEITSVEEHNGYLYFGSLHNRRIGRLALCPPGAEQGNCLAE
ncbi:MAG: SMP-30/gluconolactonase/LRE family protein [Ketobacteraceae bacterium]|nr:SMP-30/gluconolactonase/LRE family protein [Ketobacteraceae bacterium]